MEDDVRHDDKSEVMSDPIRIGTSHVSVGADLRVRPDEMEKDWLLEARRRARELDEGIVQPISAEEVRKKAQALLR